MWDCLHLLSCSACDVLATEVDLPQGDGFLPSVWAWASMCPHAAAHEQTEDEGPPDLHHLIQTPTHRWYKWPGYRLAKEEDALYPKFGTPKGKPTTYYRNVFCICQNRLMFGISLRSVLSWSHNAWRMGDCGSAISGAFLIKLRFNSVFGCWWRHKIPLLPINTDLKSV